MCKAFILRSSLRRLTTLPVVLLALFYGSPSTASAQNVPVPVPFVSTAAGGGTVCAASISTYAPLKSNEKLVGDGCPATQATINDPVALAIDRFNNVAIADQTNNLVRIIYNGGAAMAAAITAANVQTTTPIVPVVGDIYTIVGGPQATPTESTFYCTEAGSGIVGLNKQLDGCPGAEAFVNPRGMAFDQDGNLFISNVGGNFTVRVFFVGGTAVSNLITLENPTLSGPPQPGYLYNIGGTGVFTQDLGDGGLAYKASINVPRGLWIDKNENIFVTDQANALIRRIDGTTGLISTVAGYCGASSTCTITASAGDGGPATAAKLNYPYGLVFDSNGNMFIADSGSDTGAAGRVRVVYAGGTLPGISNPVVGDIYTYAGGSAGTGTQAQTQAFDFVEGVGIDANGYLYVDDYRNNTSPGRNHIWRVDPTNGNIAVIAGNGGTAANVSGAFCNGVSGPTATDTRGDGCPAPEAYLNQPRQAPVFDSLGNFYVAETNTNTVRYFSYANAFPATTVGNSVTQTLAFSYPTTTTPTATVFSIDGGAGSDFSDAGSDTCIINTTASPSSTICTNNVKFAPASGNVREGAIVTASTTALATESLIGVGSAAQVTIDPGTPIALGASIRPQGVSVDLLGNVYLSDGTGKQVLKTTLAGGTPTAVFTGLGSPQGTTTDSFGNVYVADATSNAVLQLSKSSGTISTVITDLSEPTGMAADTRGDVYVADTGNNRVLRYSALSGVSSTVSFYPQTLSAPTGLAMDASGDLYVLDSGNQRILELPPSALPQTVTLPTGVVPAAFALDHAGNLYVADTISGDLKISPVAGSVETLKTALTTPVSLAIDTNGDLFLADSGTTSVLGLKRTLSADIFAATNVNQQSLLTTLALSSIGDLSATLGSPLFVETGNVADFPSTTSSSSPCSASLALVSGAYCSESFVFAPTAAGGRSAAVTFTPTTGTTVSANLSGTGVNLLKTTLTITETVPTTTTVSYGQTATFVASLTGVSSSPVPTGTVTFFVDGTQQSPQVVSLSGNTLTLSGNLDLTVGTHIISASYSGDSVYASSATSFSLTAVPSSTTTTISSSQGVSGVTLTATVIPTYTGPVSMTGTVTFYVNSVQQGAPQPVGNGTVSVLIAIADGTYPITAVYSGDGNYAASTSLAGTLTVKRTPTTTTLTITPIANTTSESLQFLITVAGAGGTPSGTVTLVNGTKTLATGTLSSAGTYTYTLPLTTLPSTYVFTASYAGNGVFQPSTVTITETPDFVLLMPSANLVVPQGEQAVANISVVSVANYSGSMTATCSNLPTNSLCRFSPVPLTVSPGANGNLGVEVFVGTYSQVASFGWPMGRNRITGCFSILLAGVSLAGLLRRRRNSWLVRGLLGLVALCAVATGAGGCGRNNAASFQNQTYITPVGTYPVTVSLTDTNNVTHSVMLNVQVNSQ